MYKEWGERMNNIKSIYRPYANGMYKDTYIVTYKSGNKRWFDLSKLGEMPKSHFDFIMTAECIPIYVEEDHGVCHIADKFI